MRPILLKWKLLFRYKLSQTSMKSQLDLSKVDDKAIEEGIELKSERKYCQICCYVIGYIFFCLLVMNAIYNLHLEVIRRSLFHE